MKKWIWLLLALGCGHSSEPARSLAPPTTPPGHAKPTAKPRDSSAPRRTARLHFQLNGRRFPIPLVHGTVGGHATWMFIDTGANSHVMARWFAKKIGLSEKDLGDIGVDHVGRSMKAFTVDDPRVQIDGWGPLDLGPMLVADVPDAIEKLGVGVFVSPQWLGKEDDGVVLDLPASEMRLYEYEIARASLKFAGPLLAPHGGRVCEDAETTIQGMAFVLPANVQGHNVELVLDTGAERTDLLLSSKSAQRLLAGSTKRSEPLYAAGGLVWTRFVKDARVKVGDSARVLDLDLVPGTQDESCPRDGFLAMDFLRQCVLVLGRRRMDARCHE